MECERLAVLRNSVLSILILLLSLFATASAQAASSCRAVHAHATATIPQEEISKRIDTLVELQFRLQQNDFVNREQLEQSQAYFDREIRKLAEATSDFKNIYRDRFLLLQGQLKQK